MCHKTCVIGIVFHRVLIECMCRKISTFRRPNQLFLHPLLLLSVVVFDVKRTVKPYFRNYPRVIFLPTAEPRLLMC